MLTFAKTHDVKVMVEKFPLNKAQEAYNHRSSARFRAVIVPGSQARSGKGRRAASGQLLCDAAQHSTRIGRIMQGCVALFCQAYQRNTMEYIRIYVSALNVVANQGRGMITGPPAEPELSRVVKLCDDSYR